MVGLTGSVLEGRGYQVRPQAERAGPRMARGLRMEARRAKTGRSRGLVHESRPPEGVSSGSPAPKAKFIRRSPACRQSQSPHLLGVAAPAARLRIPQC